MRSSSTSAHGSWALLLSLAALGTTAGCGGPATRPEPPTGDLTVRVATVGEDRDPDGYDVLLDGDPVGSVSPSGELTLAAIPTGRHEVGLGAVQVNCRPAESSQMADVEEGTAVGVEFEVTCSPFPEERIIFQSSGGAEPTLFSIQPDGSGLSVDPPPGYHGGLPSTSPDGEWVAFTGNDGAGNQDIYVADRDGTELRRLTTHPAFDSYPAWSPAGDWIAFTSSREEDESEDIYRVRPDGSDIRRVTTDLAFDSNPDWSPDGRRIAFLSNRRGSSDIFSIAPDGSGLERLTTDAAREEAPAWSPDGSAIAFRGDRDGTYDGDWDVYVLDLGTRELTRLTDHPAVDRDPDWSPDGSMLVFVSDRRDRDELYLMRANGEGVTRLTDRTKTSFAPDWWNPPPQ